MKFRCLNCITFLVFVFPLLAHAQTFTILVSFNGTNGDSPEHMSLVQGPDGNLYGTTNTAGGNGSAAGIVFSMTLSGQLTTLYTFCAETNCEDGAYPTGGLVLGTNGSFYGTTSTGGIGNCIPRFFGCGTIFEITSTGALKTLYQFCSLPNCADGDFPFGALIQASDGNFYGTTSQGGSGYSGCSSGCGTIYRITPQGVLTTLHSFDNADGYAPLDGLIQGTDGNLYGVASDVTFENPTEKLSFIRSRQLQSCGASCGTVFKITPNGVFTLLHNFVGTDGGYPWGSVLEGNDGNLYGTTEGGSVTCDVQGENGCGTVYRVTLSGELTTLYTFCSQTMCDDGASPSAPLIQGTDGNFYGTTRLGGLGTIGIVFTMDASGNVTTLHNFEVMDGGGSTNGLLQHTNGTFYGATTAWGSGLGGTLFSLSTGLNPFAAFVRNPAKVTQTFGILGQGFTGTSSVALNGMPIHFEIKSDTFLTAIIPTGATTGTVTVTTPSGTLTSNVPFRVLPQLLSFDPPSGPAGTQVTITGVSLIQTSGVGFGNMVPANFTVNSDTQVTATVPAGAKTGFVGIQTAGGTAISTQVFTVTK